MVTQIEVDQEQEAVQDFIISQDLGLALLVWPEPRSLGFSLRDLFPLLSS